MRFSAPLLVVVAAAAHAQTVVLGRVALPSDSVPGTVRLAEAEGARYPRSTGPDSSQVTNRAFRGEGTPEHQCVEVGVSTRVRSGDFVVAGFGESGVL
jgi:hypothetical protein